MESSHGSVDRSHDAERGVEHLQVHFILNLRAPAGSRYGHYGNTDEVPRDVRVQSDDVAQVGLDHRTLRSRVYIYTCVFASQVSCQIRKNILIPQNCETEIKLKSGQQEMTLFDFNVKTFQNYQLL